VHARDRRRAARGAARRAGVSRGRPMDRRPRISLVTPVLGPEASLDDTVQSIAAQGYPDVEHIVVDTGRAAAGRDRLVGPPGLRIGRGCDSPAGALNEAFRLASGDVLGVVGAGDALAPGALLRVAGEVDPGRARHVVVGRCRLADARGRFLAEESPE